MSKYDFIQEVFSLILTTVEDGVAILVDYNLPEIAPVLILIDLIVITIFIEISLY